MNDIKTNMRVKLKLQTYFFYLAKCSLILIILGFATKLSAANPNSIEISPNIERQAEQSFVVLKLKDAQGNLIPLNDSLQVKIDDSSEMLGFVNGQCKYTISNDKNFLFVAYENKESRPDYNFYRVQNTENRLVKIPLWLSIVPPLIAIILALIFKEVISSLFVGIWAGAFILNGFSFKGLFGSFLSVVQVYIVQALNDSGHLSVIIFSMLIGGMVAIISRNGGMAGIVEKLSVFAHNAKSSQLVTWFLGIAIFFDDYANTLIVGNTMRPVTDKFNVSREKLAYLVDSTAAPVAAIAFVTTWIGAELGYIAGAIDHLGLNESAYNVFIHSLQYMFYPVFTLVFMFLLIWSNRDFGSMYHAEMRARTTGDVYDKSGVNRGEGEVDDALEALAPVKGAMLLWYNAFIPVLVVVLGTVLGLIFTGYSPEIWQASDLSFFQKISQIIGNSDSYKALLWSSAAAVIVAIALTVRYRIMSFANAIETMIDGFKTMLPAVLILILAWALGEITKEVHTAAFLTQVLSDAINPHWLPLITFVLAALVSFSTGSSWSTMAILYPLMLPTTWVIAHSTGFPPEDILPIFHNVTACVLAGSVLGDHCSPISDTTILSSLASSCNHLDHVKTQLPYALTVGLVSLFVSTLVAWVQLPFYLNYAIGIGILVLVVKFFGKKVKVQKAY
ncbi:MAG: Na+/H+ antiporter NhaC family protein [Chitinophagales bacterium]